MFKLRLKFSFLNISSIIIILLPSSFIIIQLSFLFLNQVLILQLQFLNLPIQNLISQRSIFLHKNHIPSLGLLWIITAYQIFFKPSTLSNLILDVSIHIAFLILFPDSLFLFEWRFLSWSQFLPLLSNLFRNILWLFLQLRFLLSHFAVCLFKVYCIGV